MNKERERLYLVNALSNVLTTTISIMTYYVAITEDKKGKDIFRKSIKQCKKGLKLIKTISHIEILKSMFNKIITGKEYYYVMSGSICSYEKIKTWDNTKKGFEDFLKLEIEGMRQAEQEWKEQESQKEFVRKAQEEGKQVEMVFDDKTKKLKPVIIEEKSNA